MSKKYFYNERNGSQKGPYSIDELHLLAGRGNLKPKTLIFDTEGEAFDAGEVVDFQAVRAAKSDSSGERSTSQSGWQTQGLRVAVTLGFVGMAVHWLFQANAISKGALDVSDLQLSAQYSMLALVSFGFGCVCWFLAKPPQSTF